MFRLVLLLALVAAGGLATAAVAPQGGDIVPLALAALDKALQLFGSLPEPFHTLAVGLTWLIAGAAALSLLLGLIRAVRLFIGWLRDAAV